MWRFPEHGGLGRSERWVEFWGEGRSSRLGGGGGTGPDKYRAGPHPLGKKVEWMEVGMTPDCCPAWDWPRFVALKEVTRHCGVLAALPVRPGLSTY